MYTALVCYQIMTLIDKIVHYILLLQFVAVFKLVYLNVEVKKSDTILHNIHPGPFDSYMSVSSLFSCVLLGQYTFDPQYEFKQNFFFQQKSSLVLEFKDYSGIPPERIQQPCEDNEK